MKSPTIVCQQGRTFKVEWGRCGEVNGWIVFERNLEPDTAWSAISGTHNLKRDAYATIDKWISA